MSEHWYASEEDRLACEGRWGGLKDQGNDMAPDSRELAVGVFRLLRPSKIDKSVPKPFMPDTYSFFRARQT